MIDNINFEKEKSFSLEGKWTSYECENPIGISIKKDGSLTICVEPNQYYIHLTKINNIDFKYKLKDMEGLGSKDVFSEAYLNTNPVVEIKILDSNKIEFNWLGFYNKINNERQYTEQLIGNENPIILHSCN